MQNQIWYLVAILRRLCEDGCVTIAYLCDGRVPLQSISDVFGSQKNLMYFSREARVSYFRFYPRGVQRFDCIRSCAVMD